MTRGDCTPLAGGQAMPAGVLSVFSWTNQQVVTLGANLTGEILVCKLPAGTLVKRALLVITGQAAGTGTLTVSLGRAGASFENYLVGSNAKVAAAPIYGLAIAEVGTNLAPATVLGGLPSLSAATDVKLQFVATDGGAKKLADVTGSAGYVVLETVTLAP